MENAAGVTGATRDTVRQFGHAVSEPRRVVAVPTAPAICARQAAWKRWPHVASATTPPSRESRQIEHCSMLTRASVIQTLSEALPMDREPRGGQRAQRDVHWKTRFVDASSRTSPRARVQVREGTDHRVESKQPKLGLPYRQHVGRRRVARS